MTEKTRGILTELVGRYPVLASVSSAIEESFVVLAECADHGGTILVCGNGGSAADADHIVGELLKGFRSTRPLPEDQRRALESGLPNDMQAVPDMLQSGIRAVSLCAQTALMTAVANDISADLVYAQQVLALGGTGDVLVGISTSGNARNVATALAVGRASGLATVALTGGSGGRIAQIAETRIIVPETETYKVQELHLPVYHALCAMLEEELF